MGGQKTTVGTAENKTKGISNERKMVDRLFHRDVVRQNHKTRIDVGFVSTTLSPSLSPKIRRGLNQGRRETPGRSNGIEESQEGMGMRRVDEDARQSTEAFCGTPSEF